MNSGSSSLMSSSFSMSSRSYMRPVNFVGIGPFGPFSFCWYGFFGPLPLGGAGGPKSRPPRPGPVPSPGPPGRGLPNPPARGPLNPPPGRGPLKPPPGRGLLNPPPGPVGTGRGAYPPGRGGPPGPEG